MHTTSSATSLSVFGRCLLLIAACFGYGLRPAPAYGDVASSRSFDLAAGPASATLKAFSKQSGCGIVAATDALASVHTNAVAGNYTPSQALALMLAGTGLAFTEDEQAGSFSVQRAVLPAAPDPAGDQGPPAPDVAGAGGSATQLSAPAVQPASDEEQAVVEMDPFVVDTSQDKGSYLVNSTLANTRVRMDLNDIASSISVITSQFLADTGATDNEGLLTLTPDTEVGGLNGNYAGVGNTFISGANESANLQNPQNNTRVRGLDSADQTRDFFLTDIPWDSYNVDRIDLQRGPNSILFGIGSPAGIINAGLQEAGFHDSFDIENRVGSYGTLRTSLNYNQVVLPDELAFRVAALDDDTQYRQNPAYNHQERIFGALRYDPKFLNKGSAHTSIRASFEFGTEMANNPRVLPPVNAITPFFTNEGKITWDPGYAYNTGIMVATGSVSVIAGLNPAPTPNPWISQGFGPGLGGQSAAPIFYYLNTSSPAAPVEAIQGVRYLGGGVGTNGVPDDTLPGLLYAQEMSIPGMAEFAQDEARINPSDPNVLGAANGFYKDQSLTDSSIFNFYDNLIDGPNKWEGQHWHAFNITLDQSFFDGKLAFNLAWDYQDYYAVEESNEPASPYIDVDLDANLISAPWPYNTSVLSYNGTGTPGTNPYAGYAYTGGTGSSGGNNSFSSVRQNLRAMVNGEIKASDYLGNTWLGRFLGTQLVTGLFQHQDYTTQTATWDRFAMDQSYESTTNAAGVNGLTSGQDNITYLDYMSSGPLFGYASAHGLNLQPITSIISPSGTANVKWFNSTWQGTALGISPSAPWNDPVALGSLPPVQTQNENPLNYTGYVSSPFGVLNADDGDINSLYTAGTTIRQVTTSGALTWQGSFWDDTIAVTAGWRRDEETQQSGVAPISSVTDAASMDYGLAPLDRATDEAIGDSKSWGIVLHEPKAWRDALPLGTNVSLVYDYGQNTRVTPRFGFDGSSLPNAAGQTKDYGFMISTLHDRLRLKVTWFDTKVQNANLSSVTTTTSTLGANTSFLYSSQVTGLEAALEDQQGMLGNSSTVVPGQTVGLMPIWFWNWAYDDSGYSYANYPNPNLWIGSPTSSTFLNAPDTAVEKAAVNAWIANMQPQSFFNAYGYDINVAAAKAGDYMDAIPNYPWAEGSGYYNGPTTGGLIDGQPPTGTVDNESKGQEYELVGQITPNWNVSLNASKVFATETSLGSELVNFITAENVVMQGPAGLLRYYTGNGEAVVGYWDQDIWAPFQFLEGSSGRMVSEMSPWHFNATTDYTFSHGLLKGVDIGGDFRWQAGEILGYALLPNGSNLNLNQPFWGPHYETTDIWAGWSHKLTNKWTYKIRLNVYALGTHPGLDAISDEPNGTPAQYRIVEGQSWLLTNSLEF